MKCVTAIMLTRGRRLFASIALGAFLRQTYLKDLMQLLIIDDREEPSFPETPRFEYVDYVRSDIRNIAEKRNLGCSIASFDVLCSWDDDDWSHRDRVADQVKRLDESGKQVTGYHSMLFYQPNPERAAKYVNDTSYALGTSLMFTREWWKQHPFRLADKAWGEDNNFVNEARHADELISVDAGQLMVARAHPGNTSTKDLSAHDYRYVPLSAIPAEFFQ